MKALRLPSGAVGLLFLLSACSDSDKYERREERIENALEGNRDINFLGSDAVWLVKASSLAPNDRTAVFFGYGDNLTACTAFAEAYEEKNEEEYRCESFR